jgi:F-type H+-transporting ATPase subunit b
MSTSFVPAVVLAAAEEGEPSPLMPHLSELFVGLVAFTLLFFFLRAKVFPLFEKTYAERSEAIEGGIRRAEEAQAEAQRALEQYRSQLADARGEAARIREDAKVQGAAILADMRQAAQAEAARITERAQTQLAAEREQVVRSLRAEVGTLATQLAERVVGESLADDARAGRVVERFLAELESEHVAGSGTGPEFGPDGGSRGRER